LFDELLLGDARGFAQHAKLAPDMGIDPGGGFLRHALAARGHVAVIEAGFACRIPRLMRRSYIGHVLFPQETVRNYNGKP
jgi:hypothetical protein